MKLYIDIGGTNLRAEIHGLADVIYENSSSTELDLVEYIERKLDQYKEIDFVGISYAGQVKDGVIISAPNIEVSKKEIKKYFEEKYEISLEIENDLNCAVIAEADYFKEKNLVAIYIGTGIGSGFVENGKLVHSNSNLVGEIGHIPYKKAPFKCGCGKDNCIELFASGSALQKWSKEENVNLQKLKQADSEIASQFEEALLHAIAIAITLFNPKVLVLGGGVVEKNGYLLDLVKSSIKKYAPVFSLNDLEIKKTELTNAAMSGVKLLGRD